MKVITVKQMQEIDKRTIDENKVSGNLLMERAGIGSGEKILEYLSHINSCHIKRFVLLAGKLYLIKVLKILPNNV